jgi:hypothetical protein
MACPPNPPTKSNGFHRLCQVKLEKHRRNLRFSKGDLGEILFLRYHSMMSTQRLPIVVIGAGGAGILAAWRSAVLGSPVILLERNRRIGIKLLISGGGKCNITHDGPLEELYSAFTQRESRFLKPAFFRFQNTDVVQLIEEGGVRTTVRPDGRVFPAEGRARHVVAVFERLLTKEKVDLRVNSRAESIEAEDGHIQGLRVGSSFLPASLVILATGGASYPTTGTTGDGFRWAKRLGHTIVPVRPALAPLILSPPLPAQWRGIALRRGRLSARFGSTVISSWNGDVLITHDGISGPAALEISRPTALALEKATVTIEYDFLPGTDSSSLDAELTDLLRTAQGFVATFLERWLPNRMIRLMLISAGIAPETRCYSLTREGRRAIVALLKAWQIGTVNRVPLERGEVTAGGVSLDEIDPHTMHSRKVQGLYVCGEVLDVAGPVGGYNLQAAFSTGFVAGDAAARAWLRESPSSQRR